MPHSLQTTISNPKRLSLLIVLSLSLHTNRFLHAFTPPRGLRLGRRDRFFSVEHILPPLTSTTPMDVSPRQLHHHHYRGASNATMDTPAQTWTIPYSSCGLEEFYFTRNFDDDDNGEFLPVLYTNDPKVINRWLVEHVPMDSGAIGFDTESVPDVPWIHSEFKGRPVTVQLSTTSASIVIPLLLNGRYNRACVPLLEAVLMDENIIKCGCGIDDDLLDLRRFVPGLKGLEARSRFDVGLLGTSKNRLGLKTLARILLQRRLEKPKRLTLSDWSKSPLSDEQVAYGARDAWCGAALLEELQRLDPETFETETLIDFLQSQHTLRELAARRQQRRKAKKLLHQYRKPYRDSKASMPRRVKRQVSKLNQVLKDTQLGATTVESLGFIADEASP